MVDNSGLLGLNDACHLVLVKQESTGDTSLVSSHFLDWRPVLAAPNMRCTLTIEMMGIGKQSCFLWFFWLWEQTTSKYK